MLNSYSETKSELNKIIAILVGVAVSEHSKEMVQLVGNKLEANIFSLVIVGQFKRGKTTFINALLGQDLLPTSIIPLTSIITVIKYGEKLNAVAFMNDSSKKEIPIKDIQLYVTEKHNPKNEKGNVLLHSSAEKIQSIINEETLLAELEEKSLRIPLQELESKLANFKVFLSDINQGMP